MGNPNTLHQGDTIHMFDICTAREMILLSRNGGTHHEFLRAHKVGCTVPSSSNCRWLRRILHASSGMVRVWTVQRCAAKIQMNLCMKKATVRHEPESPRCGRLEQLKQRWMIAAAPGISEPLVSRD